MAIINLGDIYRHQHEGLKPKKKKKWIHFINQFESNLKKIGSWTQCILPPDSLINVNGLGPCPLWLYRHVPKTMLLGLVKGCRMND